MTNCVGEAAAPDSAEPMYVYALIRGQEGTANDSLNLTEREEFKSGPKLYAAHSHE